MLRSYMARIARLGDILIRADSAEEAAQMAMRIDSGSLRNFKIHVEIISSGANQDSKDIKIKGKKRKAKKWKPFCMDDDEIPF